MASSTKFDLIERVSQISSNARLKDDSYVGVKTPNDNGQLGLEGGALRAGGVPNIWGREYIGLLIQYAAIGIVYGTLPGTIYPFLQNYLNMEGTSILSAKVLVTIPWSFKVFYGIATDCIPIFGYRRRPFMLIGWTLCFIALLVMACMHVGKPYYPASKYRSVDESTLPADILAQFNFDAPNQGGKFVVWMMFAAVGYVGADCAADALVCEIAQREPEAIRGRSQTAIYTMRTIFVTLSSVLTGFAFNGDDYGGTFDFSISFPVLMLILAICLLPTFPLTWFFIKEEKHPGVNFKEYMSDFWALIQRRPVYQVIAFKFFAGIFENFTITCSDPMQTYWAKATPLNEKVWTMVGHAIYGYALYATSKWGLGWNWRFMHAITLIAVTFIDAIVSFLTTWDVVRNQWFWLGVPILENLPQSMNFIIATYVAVEIAGDGNEGAVYGLISTVTNIAGPFASTITKNVDGQFKVTNADIKADTNEVRWGVTYVLLIRYIVNLLGMAFLPLLPRQKTETQELMRSGGSSKWLGIVTIFYISFALCWSVMVNIMSIYPTTSCLHLVGGSGC